MQDVVAKAQVATLAESNEGSMLLSLLEAKIAEAEVTNKKGVQTSSSQRLAYLVTNMLTMVLLQQPVPFIFDLTLAEDN